MKKVTNKFFIRENLRSILSKWGMKQEFLAAGVSMKEIQLQLRHHSLDMVDRYLRQLGVSDMGSLRAKFPRPGE